MSKEFVQVDLNWRPVGNSPFFSLWDKKHCLYAYLVGSSIGYIGKAVDCTVRQRFGAHGSDGVSNRIRSAFNTLNVDVIVADVSRRDGKAPTPSLIYDIESVLIYERKPIANISQKDSINVDYPISVECGGSSWPTLWTTHYHDGKAVPSQRSIDFAQALAFGRMVSPNPFGLSSLASDMRISRMARPEPPPVNRMAVPNSRPNLFSDLLGTPSPLRDALLGRSMFSRSTKK